MEVQMSTYGDIALGLSGSDSVPEESQLSKPTFMDENDDFNENNSLWNNDDE